MCVCVVRLYRVFIDQRTVSELETNSTCPLDPKGNLYLCFSFYMAPKTGICVIYRICGAQTICCGFETVFCFVLCGLPGDQTQYLSKRCMAIITTRHQQT